LLTLKEEYCYYTTTKIVLEVYLGTL